MNTPALIPSDAIVFHQDQVRTTSFKVAEAFGREHKNVTAKIRSLDCSDQFLTANFSAVKFEHRGNQYDAYEMTKDGFIFLVMGFTGKKAAQVKEAYINAFNAMAEELEHQRIAASREITTEDIMAEAKKLSAEDLGKVLGAARAIKGRRLVPDTLTPMQQRHIQTMVAKLANQPGNSFPQVYRSVKDRFNVGSYKDVPAGQYPALCRYLGGNPKDEPLSRIDQHEGALEGDFIEGGQMALPHSITVNYPATGMGNFYDYRDMMDCGWVTQVDKLLYDLERHRGNRLTLAIEDVSGLQKEVRSLQKLVETLTMRLGRVRDAAMYAANQADQPV